MLVLSPLQLKKYSMADIIASDLEILVIGWLNHRKINYSFQTSLAGGWYSLGGSVVDFIIGDLAWRVQGEYFHRGVEKTGSDVIQKEQLTAMGYVVVDLLAEDLLNRLNETLTLALKGLEMLR